MLFREHREPSKPLTLEEKNAASLAAIDELEIAIRHADSYDRRCSLIDQQLDLKVDYVVRNGQVEKRPGLAHKIGRVIVGWAKDIPARIVHPG